MVEDAAAGLAVLSGRTGEPLVVVEEIDAGAALSVAVAPRLDPSRVVVGLEIEKRVLVLDRITGEVDYELRGGCRFFGSKVGLVEDRDGDGVAEVWVGCDRGIHVYSGQAHVELDQVHFETKTHSVPFPEVIADVDRDGFEDCLYADERERGVISSQPVSLAVVRNHDGTRLVAEIPYDSLMASNAPTSVGDLDGNGRVELALPTSRSVFVVELR
jgi:hypothetical protein